MLIENYVALSAKDYQEEVNQDIRLNFKKHKYVRIKRNEKGEVVYSNGLKINSVNLESVFNRDM